MSDAILKTFYEALVRQLQAADSHLPDWNHELIAARLNLVENIWNGLVREQKEIAMQINRRGKYEQAEMFLVAAESKYMDVKVRLQRALAEKMENNGKRSISGGDKRKRDRDIRERIRKSSDGEMDARRKVLKLSRSSPASRGRSSADLRMEETSPIIICSYCDQFHAIYRCRGFLRLSLERRKECVSKFALCESCLQPGHHTNQCSRSCCQKCPGKKHNSTLCPKNPTFRLVNGQ